MPEPKGENSTVLKLSDAFTQAHGRYLHAQIDRTFRAQILTPLQAALHKFEKQEKTLYSGNISSDSKNLLLRLRSVNLLVEGLYWVGAYREAGMELQKYVKIETILRESSGKKLSDIIVDLSQLDEMKEAAPLLRKLSKSKTVFQEERRRIVREVIRVGVNIAVISDYGSHSYEEAAGLLEICRGLTEGISSDDSYCYGRLCENSTN